MKSIPAFFLAWALCSLPLPVTAQVAAFRFDSTRVPVGRVYEYIKTNCDGTHPSRVSLYVADVRRIEALKWSPEDTTATLVVALLNWDRFSAQRLESWALSRGAVPHLRASLDTDSGGRGVRVSFQPDSLLVIRGWPWHSYDFDFASLNLTLAHLSAPEAPFTFQRADITYAETGPPFADMGPVYVRFVGREQRQGQLTRRYELSGPGLQDHTGRLWAAVDGAHVIEYEFPFPDEPGYQDVRFLLQSIRELSPPNWDAYKHERLQGRP